MTLVTMDYSNIPQWLLGKLGSLFLEISIMSLSLSAASVFHYISIRILLAKLIIISLISHCFNTSGLVSSGPFALFPLIYFFTFSYSELVKRPVLIFNSFLSRIVLIFSFPMIIFGGLPNSSLK